MPAKGFTLVELMITIVVLAILLTVAVPDMTELIRDNQTASQTNKFISDMNLARSEAVKRGVQVTVCKSTDGAACSTASNWEQGWIVFADLNPVGAVGAGDTLIAVNQGLDTNFTLRVGSTFSNWASYLPTGESVGSGGAPGAGANDIFRLCRPDADTAQSRSIDYSATGRMRLSEGTTSCP